MLVHRRRYVATKCNKIVPKKVCESACILSIGGLVEANKIFYKAKERRSRGAIQSRRALREGGAEDVHGKISQRLLKHFVEVAECRAKYERGKNDGCQGKVVKKEFYVPIQPTTKGETIQQRCPVLQENARQETRRTDGGHGGP